MFGELDPLIMLWQLGLPQTAGSATLVYVLTYFVLARHLDRVVGPVRSAIIEIQATLANAGFEVRYHLTEKRTSPIRASDYGCQLVRESGLQAVLDKRRSLLFRDVRRRIRKWRVSTSYDVQEAAREALLARRNRGYMVPVKDYSFRHGVDLEMILRVGALILRDRILEERGRRG